MKNNFFLMTSLLLLLQLVYKDTEAQGPESTWMASELPYGGSHHGLKFTSSGPQTFAYSGTGPLSSIVANNALCDASGNILFYTSGVSKKVYSADGVVMPNGSNLNYPTSGNGYSMPPVIIARPGHPNEYYLFHNQNGGVFYSRIDMSLNGGLGDLAEKNQGINNFSGLSGIAINYKMTAAQGCSNIWVIVRSKNSNEYRSYAVRSNGVDTHAVVSAIGLFPLSYYSGDLYGGKLKMSPDQTKMAASCSKAYAPDGSLLPGGIKGGIELYTFEKCSGVLKDPVILDSSQFFDGICFSPDNSKLYASSRDTVFQFDLSLGSPAAMTASKTMMLVNTPIPYFNIFCNYYCDTIHMDIGDLKRGPDGKIYMGNNRPISLMNALPVAAFSRYHCINNPNMAGLAASPQLDAVSYPWGYDLIGTDMPPDYIAAPSMPDTFYHPAIDVDACFKDTFPLFANENGSCFLWDNGLRQRSRQVTASGRYHVGYFLNDCSYHVDTFNVRFIPLPELSFDHYSCPNSNRAKAVISNNNTELLYSVQWMDAAANLLSNHSNVQSDSITTLSSGNYYVRITTASGCDTTIAFTIKSLTLPAVSFWADTLICNNEEITFSPETTAPLLSWSFDDGAVSQVSSPRHAFTHGGNYNVALMATNLEGCSDTAFKLIHVRELKLQLSCDKNPVERGTAIRLQTQADEPFGIFSWTPSSYFNDQTAYYQQFPIYISDSFTVSGKSDAMGCVASASIKIIVDPFALIPNAFSPNGDGLNDYFKPVLVGDNYNVISFRIFNRWGQLVFEAYGNRALIGWDGNYNGANADMGTYFYHLEVALPSGTMKANKGELTLIR